MTAGGGRRDGTKRAMDVVVSAVSFVLLAPVNAVIALVVRATMGPPVLFRQLRPGLHGRPFTILKFRTMRDVSEAATDDADRITPVGRFLRSTSLDELPELVNVLRGDMSLVGPRPLLMEYLDRYTPFQARRHEVRPGITGLAQVEGRNALSWEQRFALDVWYVDNHSLALDLRILARTILAVALRRGISHPGEATMKAFVGTAAPPTVTRPDHPVTPGARAAAER